MRKITFKFLGTILAFIIGFSSTVKAQGTTENVVPGGVYRSWELKAGMKIALRGSMSTNKNHWLNATTETLKSETFSTDCIFEIEAADTDGKFVLKNGDKYLGKATKATTDDSDPVTFVTDKSEAAEFTFSCPTISDNTKQFPQDDFSYNDNMFVRFTTTFGETNVYLNTNYDTNKTKYSTGTGGFSVWLVYSVGDHSNSCQAKKAALNNLDFLVDGTKVMFKDMNSAQDRQGWLYERDDNKISTTQYEPTNSLNSTRYIWTVNKVDGGYNFTNLATGRWMRFDNSGNSNRSDNSNVDTKNEGEKGVFTIAQGSTDQYWKIGSNGQYFNGDSRNGVETEGFNTWNDAHDYEIYPIFTQNDEIIAITIQYVNTVGDVLKEEGTTYIEKDGIFTFSAPSIVNYSIKEYKVDDVTVDVNTPSQVITQAVTIQYVYDFTGFKTTEIVDNEFVNPTWYRLGIHNNQNRRYLKYHEGDNTIIDLITSDNISYDDSQLWCFTGSLTEGYKIYNKQAGASLSINYSTEYGTGNDKHAIMGNASTSAAVWKIATSSATESELSNGFCFVTDQASDNYKYLNQRGTYMSYWEDNGNGSTFVVFNVEEETANAFNNTVEKAKQYQIGTGLGQFTDPNGSFSTVLAKAEEGMPKDLTERIELMNQLKEAANALVINQPSTGKFYRFKSATRNNYIASNGTSGRPLMTADPEEAVFYLTADNKLVTSSLRTMDNYNVVANLGQATTFKASKMTIGTYIIRNNGHSFYAKGTGEQLDRWEVEDESINQQANCAWILEEVTEPTQQPTLSRTISSDAGYATLGAPVALNIPERVKAYTVTVDANNEKALLTEITGGIIPAGCGVVLEKTDGGSEYNFTFAAGAAAIKENALVPLYTETTVSTDINAYVLANKESVLGFYQLDANSRTIGANKAYLVLPSTLNHVRSITIGGPTTGIEETVANGNETEEYYDLQGRRVLNPTKGIYVTKSGKKVIINK